MEITKLAYGNYNKIRRDMLVQYTHVNVIWHYETHKRVDER